MTLLIKNTKAILFMHIPKCGGSSVVKAFKNNGFSSHLEIRDLPPQKCLKASLQHQTPDVLKNIISEKNLDAAFIVVRNPYARIISEFNWEFRKTPINKRPDFNQWILKSLSSTTKRPNYSDNHFRPAIDYIDEELPCEIFKLEDGLRLINEYYLEDNLFAEHARLSREKASNSFQYKASKNTFNFNKQSLEAINSFYYQDFCAFGYKMTDMHKDKNVHNNNAVNKEFNQIQEHKIMLAAQWREITLKRLIDHLEAKINRLHLKLKEQIGNKQFLPYINTKAQETNHLFSLLCENTLLKLNSISEEISHLYETKTSINRINTIIQIIDSYKAQLKRIEE